VMNELKMLRETNFNLEDDETRVIDFWYFSPVHLN
jgi:hypothetical protein